MEPLAAPVDAPVAPAPPTGANGSEAGAETGEAVPICEPMP
ncbi:Uncharacterised protein [Mycobacteroides abscessus subsp. abscessus]|nr:Uncharacterised protein [Mycobacteroides abscessus subsp. abscessus]